MEFGGVKNDREEGLMQQKAALDRSRSVPDNRFGNHLYFLATRLQHRNSDVEDLSFRIEGPRPKLGTHERVFSTSFSIVVIDMFE